MAERTTLTVSLGRSFSSRGIVEKDGAARAAVEPVPDWRRRSVCVANGAPLTIRSTLSMRSLRTSPTRVHRNNCFQQCRVLPIESNHLRCNNTITKIVRAASCHPCWSPTSQHLVSQITVKRNPNPNLTSHQPLYLGTRRAGMIRMSRAGTSMTTSEREVY